MTLSEGTRLGPYEILASVGAGGMGEVYRARDTRLDRTVAIKVLPSHLSSNPEVRQRFDREARTISSLSHPHICALHDVGHQDGIDYLVMEFLEGETLTDRLSRGALPAEQVLRYGIEIADALDKAHRQGIVHRDLKPGNIMLTKSGVKLVDFGLARWRPLDAAGRGQTAAEQEPMRSSLLPPEKTTYHFIGEAAGPPAISPDGFQVAFTARDSSGKALLWVRALDSPAPRALPGTEDAMYPFWSPDSRFIGFFAGGKLKRIEASGGPALALCDAGDGRGGTWNKDGMILFEPHFREPLFRVPATGGKAAPATKFDESRKETTHRFPAFLPDGTHFLYLAGSHSVGTESELHAIYLGSLDGKPPRHLVNARSKPLYAAGHLLFVRQKTLMAQPFDAKSGALSGEAFPVVGNVQEDPGFFTAVFSVSDNGVLVYQEEGGTVDQHQFTWFDRTGKHLQAVGPKGNIWNPRLSHDGRRVAFGQGDPGDLWLEDLSRHVTTRLTFDPSDENSPAWSPDDARIFFMSQRSGGGDIYQKAASGTGADELLFSSSALKNPTSASPDGRYLLFDALNPKTKWDVEALSLPDRKVTPFLHSEFDENEGDFSPDGHWIAYASNESGRYEVYVQPFPGPGGKWQVSTAGGVTPVWRRDGKELFYVAPDRKLMAVAVRTGAAFEPETARPLFEARIRNDPSRHYDASADGQRFLLNMPLGEETSPPITLIQNWTALLRQAK